jgi:hypothetical protein
MAEAVNSIMDQIGVNTKITGNEMVDKAIGAAFGLVGFGGLLVIAAIGISKIPIVDDIFNNKSLRQAKKAVLLVDTIYQGIEPLIRQFKPEWREKMYWIDQGLDFIDKFFSKNELVDIFK